MVKLDSRQEHSGMTKQDIANSDMVLRARFFCFLIKSSGNQFFNIRKGKM